MLFVVTQQAEGWGFLVTRVSFVETVADFAKMPRDLDLRRNLGKISLQSVELKNCKQNCFNRFIRLKLSLENPDTQNPQN